MAPSPVLRFWVRVRKEAEGYACRNCEYLPKSMTTVLCMEAFRTLYFGRSFISQSTQYLRTLVPKSIKGMAFGARHPKYCVLGPSGMDSNVLRSSWEPAARMEAVGGSLLRRAAGAHQRDFQSARIPVPGPSKVCKTTAFWAGLLFVSKYVERGPSDGLRIGDV